MTQRRTFCFAAFIAAAAPACGAVGDAPAWTALGPAGIVLFRHAEAPGVGDPAGFQLGKCSTQRNLNDTGRAQARRLGQAFRQRGVAVGRVLTSQWCRTRETAELAFPGHVQEAPAFNSFFNNDAHSDRQTREARAILSAWTGPGVLVVVTHQVNITALTGIVPASGEGVIVKSDGKSVQALGRLGA